MLPSFRVSVRLVPSCNLHFASFNHNSALLLANSLKLKWVKNNARNAHSGPSKELSTEVIQKQLVELLNNNINRINRHYENFFGIAQIRQIQEKVLEAEQDFVDIAYKRKLCQEQLDTLKEDAKAIRDKLERTSRSSETYLQLITEEHELLKDQGRLNAQLYQLKDREQFTFDRMSKLLRQSHESERLRQERSKYWGIVSVFLSLMGGIVGVITYKIKDKNVIVEMIKQLEAKQNANLEKFNSEISHIESKLNLIDSDINLLRLETQMSLDRLFKETQKMADSKSSKSHKYSSWTSYVPGLSSLGSLLRYFYRY